MLLLSKVLSLLIYPLSFSLLLLVFAMLLRMRGARGRANSLTLLATAWLYFCATEWGANTLLSPLEAAYPAFANEELPEAEAIVVLGGGIIGCSTAYHLARLGKRDVLLLEQGKLTCGSTWHAAGLLPLFNMSYSVGKLHQYSVNFYHELQEETGQDVGLKIVSNIRLAACEDRMDEYRYYASVAQTVGVDVRFLTPEEVKEVWPM